MEESSKIRKKFWRKVALIICGFFLLEALLSYFLKNFIDPSISITYLAGLLIFGVLVALILVIAGSRYPKARGSYRVDRYPSELDRLATAFEKTADDAILRKLGKEAYSKLYMEELQFNFDGLCRGWLGKSEVKGDDELRFFILAKLANFHAREDNFTRAAECLRETLGIKPETFILLLRLAEVNELLGAGPEAVAAYQKALQHAPEFQLRLKEYINAQIRRVQTQGPSKQRPSGYRFILGG